jgi:hypothetical protein
MSDLHAWLPPRVRTMQIIALSLAASASSAILLFLYLRLSSAAPVHPEPVLSYIAAAFLAVNVGLSFALPRLIGEAQLKQLARRGDVAPQQLVDVYQTTMIVGLALLEGGAFFCAIAYFVEGPLWVLLPVVIAIVLMALRLPTESAVLNWLGAAAERVQELRQ